MYYMPDGVSVPFTSGSSLQHPLFVSLRVVFVCFSSLYIGILAATRPAGGIRNGSGVSVPFTSGSSLQRFDLLYKKLPVICFSSLYIGILAATG